MNRQQDTLRGLAGGLFLGFFLIGLAFAVFFGLSHYFLTVLFLGLACSSLLGMISTFDPKKVYGGIQGFIWFLGLAILFLPQIAFWPWGVGGFLIICGISAIVGALAKPIIAGIGNMGILGAAARATQQARPTDQQPYQPYEQGYQPPQAPEAAQEGGEVYSQLPPQELPPFEQPQVQYPQLEEAPLQK
jgi:hypothetical protein